MPLNFTFEEGLVIFVKNEGKCCVILANFINEGEGEGEVAVLAPSAGIAEVAKG